MSGPTCSVCGMGGYWVAHDVVAGEDRCVNHLSADGGQVLLQAQESAVQDQQDGGQ